MMKVMHKQVQTFMIGKPIVKFEFLHTSTIYLYTPTQNF